MAFGSAEGLCVWKCGVDTLCVGIEGGGLWQGSAWVNGNGLCAVL